MKEIITGISELTAAVFIASCVLGSFFSGKQEHKYDNVFFSILTDTFVMLITQAAYYLISGNGSIKLLFLIISSCAYYVLMALFAYYLWLIISERKNIGKGWITAEVIVVISGAAIWAYCVLIKKIGMESLQDSVWYYLGQAMGYLAVLICLIMLLSHAKEFGRKQLFMYISCFIVPAFFSVIRFLLGGVSFVIISASVMMFIIYIVERVENQKRYLKQKSKLSEAELALMVHQVQPHFMYNIFNSIYYLCDSDPKTAQEAIGEFADYFRANLDSITTSAPVSINKELENVKKYLALEKLRFEDRFTVEYDIDDTDFLITPLTVRQLVENAVKHGVDKTDHTLHITVRVRDYPDRYEIRVEDDGPGYKQGVYADNERKHIGIENIRRRLELISKATLEISGSENNGTVAVITLKK
ncbi:MAG: histidine kinase [Lachnospiraceae bacterium]|nr:histidine kinase [Lachnospiraceae bacterium]